MEYRFKIDAYTPDSIPMERLAEYMAELAVLLGEPQSVHFVRLEEGSVVLVNKIENEAAPKVDERTARVRSGDGPPEALAAYRKINRILREDNGIGLLTRDSGAEVIKFPGREAEPALTFGAFNQEGSLDGTLIRLGGARELVPVHVQTSAVRYACLANRITARRLGHYLFKEIRLFGEGRWHRDEEGQWILDRFTITHFEPLDETPLSAVVASLRDVSGNGWAALPDAWEELRRLRHDPDEHDGGVH